MIEKLFIPTIKITHAKKIRIKEYIALLVDL